MTEKEAISAVLRGDKQAFGLLYDTYVQKVFRFIYYRTGHKQLAEDLTSIAFTKAFSKFDTFKVGSSFNAWILSIARNTLIDHFRTNKATSDIEEAFDISDQTNLQREYELKEKMKEVQDYLKTLPEEHREIIIMRLWDGMSYEEISAVLGRKEASLRVTFSRIVSKMQKELIAVIILIALITK